MGLHFLNLPDEVILHIFSFLPVADCLNIASVCKKFCAWVDERSLWRLFAERRWNVVNVASTDDGKKWKETFKRRIQQQKELESKFHVKLLTSENAWARLHMDIPIVIDNGSAYIKAGCVDITSSDQISCIPSLIGEPKYPCPMIGIGQKDCFLGQDDQQKRGILALNKIIERGIITDFDKYEKLLHHVFYAGIRRAPEDHPVLLTEAAFRPYKQRERLLELLMEKFRVPALYIAISGILSLYTYDVTTGVTVDIGDGVTQIVPMCNSKIQTHAIVVENIGGIDVTEYLLKILTEERGLRLQTTAEFEIVREIKEKHCYISTDFDSEFRQFQKEKPVEEFHFPDGRTLELGSETIRCSEVLFKPSLANLKLKGIAQLIYDCISRCDANTRGELWTNINLVGGVARTKNFKERLLHEVNSLLLRQHRLELMTGHNPSTTLPSVILKEHSLQNFAAWRGGAKVAKCPEFLPLWITRELFAEYGTSVIHLKCL